MWKVVIVLTTLSLAAKAQHINHTPSTPSPATLNLISQKMSASKQALAFTGEEKVTILCSNRSSPSFQAIEPNDKQVLNKLDFRKPITLIVHGWNGNISKPFMRNLTQNYARYVDSNLCLVEWSNLATCEYSVVSEQGVKKVANHLTKFVRFLHRKGFAYDDMTLVGHSLGAHIAGLVGKNVDGQVGAIYGLDPAGVLFTFPLDVGEEKRLAPTDAQYVQTIYTSSGTLAMSVAAGQQNFWVNRDGAHPQPGCEDASTENDEFERMYESMGCSHRMALVYFTEALNPEVNFTMKRCYAYLMYQSGLCVLGTKDKLGIHAERISGNFYGTVVLP
ncbi:lipase member H [Aedes aegypti]|uniref:Lipase domain-containing protein n=1 Tax=Aedes aegypti TaxID=7159 RepID=A0A1S4FI14_AEDAE|nr:lipase member H [Aedes aegypti]